MSDRADMQPPIILKPIINPTFNIHYNILLFILDFTITFLTYKDRKRLVFYKI